MLMINIIINNTIVIIAAVIAVVTVPILSQQTLLTINMFITKIKLIEYKSFDIIMIFIFNISSIYSYDPKQLCVSTMHTKINLIFI